MDITNYKRTNKTIAQMSATEIVELLAWYDFRDPHDNPLTNCTDFLDLVQRAVGQPSAGMARREALEVALARVAELEAAMREDIADANSICEGTNCEAWTIRGKRCGTCPCEHVAESARVIGCELRSFRKVETDYKPRKDVTQ
jgi:hypothetical protein